MNSDLVVAFISGQLRHLLTGVAGYLVTAGALSSDQTAQFVQIGVGIGMYLFGAVWSWWEKKGQAKVAAKLAELRKRVRAIPSLSNPTTAAASTEFVNNAITAAKAAA